MTTARWIAVAVLFLATVFAFQGGIFSMADANALDRELAGMTAEVKSLNRQVDSLRAFHDSLENSPVVQERVAREDWGMIRPGELSILQEVGDSTTP